ncbi:MAG: glycosyltransferase, partial [Candidatus Bathyarchaeota archaeon]|nr:glycosyltransferase [Candidatus Bathyarchaeota archaeon]
EKLCLTTIEVLKLANHEVTLVTVEKTNWGSVRKMFGNVIRPDHEVYFTTAKLSKRLSHWVIAAAVYIIELLAIRSRRKYDLIINTYGDLFNSIADIVYVHFPWRATLKYSQIPPITNPETWNIYLRLYNSVASLLDKNHRTIVLTNSRFVEEVVKEFLHRSSIVVHPPVDIEAFMPPVTTQRREDFVITISGFSPKRRLEGVPYIAKHVKSARFLVIGKADVYSLATLKKLKRLIRILGVKDRVELLTNIPHSTLLDLLSRAKVYLHVMPQEHFGTAIVEAMASGCVPVVHRSGGPWLDILNEKQGEYGYAYDTLQEAAEFIKILLTDETTRKRMASAAMERSSTFDKAVFKRKIVRIAENFYACKNVR